MVELLDTTFSALADPTRRAILARLAEGEASVMELAAPFDMSQPAISKHLKVLERAGLVSRGRDAQRRPCRLEARPLKVATDWLENYRSYWEESYQRLDTLLDDVRVGRKRVARLMRSAGILGVHRRRRHGLTRRDPAATAAPDLVNRQFTPPAPDRLWVADITQQRTDQGWLYLAVV